MDRLEAMTILLDAVDAGSLSAAGRRLGVPLATISRRVSELEDHLKVRLVIRGSRKLMLTDAGRDYVAGCRRILEDISEVERNASGEYRTPQGELVISAPVVLSRIHLLPILVDFLEAYPEIKVQLLQSDRAVNLLEEHVDLAVRIGALPDSNLIASRVGMIQRVLCASPRYLEARGVPKTPEDLAEHDCIAFEAISAGLRWEFNKDGEEYSVPIQSRLVVTTADVAAAAAEANLGIARVLSYQVTDQLANGQLKRVLESYEPATMPLSFVYPSQRQLPLKLRAFLDFATPRLRDRLGYGPS